jgi:uncharacterized protein with PQ loop repeat
MSPAAVLGGLGTEVGLVRAMPQLLRLARTGDVHGVSIDTAATSSAISFGWATYGVMTDQWPVAVATACSGFVFADVTFLAIGLGRRPRELRTAPVWLVVLVGSVVVAGSEGLGVLLPLSVLVGNLPQVITAYRESDLSGLSAPTWALSFADGAVWEAYALVSGDPSIALFGLLQMATSGLIVARKWAR